VRWRSYDLVVGQDPLDHHPLVLQIAEVMDGGRRQDPGVQRPQRGHHSSPRSNKGGGNEPACSVTDGIPTTRVDKAASTLGTTHHNVKQIALALTRKGFLEIVPDEADGRVRRLATTTRSRDYWRRRSPSDHESVLQWFAGLSPGDATELLRLLLRLQDSVRAALAAACRSPGGLLRMMST
jgi:DNA-binding MarR family transcriptional regulator